MIKRLLCLLLGLSPVCALAAGSDFNADITNSLHSLLISGEPLFLAFGFEELRYLGIIMLTIYGLKWALASSSNFHGHFDFPGAIHWFCLYLVASVALHYYQSPLPWCGSSFAQLLPDTGHYFAHLIDQSGMTALANSAGQVIVGMQKPSPWDPLEILTYAFIAMDMLFIQGVLFGVTIIAPIATAIGTLLGPILIPWLVVPRLAWLFWNFITFMLKYSFYPVVAAALAFVWTTVLNSFFLSTFEGDYSLGHFLTMIVPMGVLNIGLCVSIFKVPSFVADLFTGSSSAGLISAGGGLMNSARRFGGGSGVVKAVATK